LHGTPNQRAISGLHDRATVPVVPLPYGQVGSADAWELHSVVALKELDWAGPRWTKPNAGTSTTRPSTMVKNCRPTLALHLASTTIGSPSKVCRTQASSIGINVIGPRKERKIERKSKRLPQPALDCLEIVQICSVPAFLTHCKSPPASPRKSTAKKVMASAIALCWSTSVNTSALLCSGNQQHMGLAPPTNVPPQA